MDKELKAKWVAALRSGEYTQVRGRFREADCFCCLGVLADISDKGEWGDYEAYVIREEGSPSKIFLDGDLGVYGRPLFGIDEATEKALIKMNDDEKKNFAEIADYIESAV